jgi:formate hydrogenlyase subunit 3/multisubunit Na+/H+ antiporter MnhD subunit
MTAGYPPFAGFFCGIFLMLLTAYRTVLEIDVAVLTVFYGLLLAALLVAGITAGSGCPPPCCRHG